MLEHSTSVASDDVGQEVSLKEETFSNSVVTSQNVEQYDEMVLGLIYISDTDGIIEYSCKQCPYSRMRKSHVMEHVGAKHIEGFVFPCKSCGKIKKSKVALRIHGSKCKSAISDRINN